MFGYCCTGSVETARQPISTIARLTTTARTGWRMKTSVNEPMASASLRLRLGGDGDEHAFAELERARRGDALALGETGADDDVVAEHGPALDGAQMGPRLLVGTGGDDEH